jgi:hypothetical protein
MNGEILEWSLIVLNVGWIAVLAIWLNMKPLLRRARNETEKAAFRNGERFTEIGGIATARSR